MVDPGRCNEVLIKTMLMWVQLGEAPAYLMDASDVQCDPAQPIQKPVCASRIEKLENRCFD